MPDTRQIPVCTVCGSSDVTMDGLLSWNTTTQEWEVCGTFDNTDCNNCGGECHIEFKTVDSYMARFVD